MLQRSAQYIGRLNVGVVYIVVISLLARWRGANLTVVARLKFHTFEMYTWQLLRMRSHINYAERKWFGTLHDATLVQYCKILSSDNPLCKSTR